MGVLGGYAIHEHSYNRPGSRGKTMFRTTAALNLTQHQLSDLSAKVNMLAARSETPAAPPAATAPIATGRTAATRPPREDSRYKKLQSQLDAQGKAIDQTRNDLVSTQGNHRTARVPN